MLARTCGRFPRYLEGDWDLGSGWGPPRPAPTSTTQIQILRLDRANSVNDRLDSYTNTNLSLTLDNPAIRAGTYRRFVKNPQNKTVVTDQSADYDDTSGLRSPTSS